MTQHKKHRRTLSNRRHHNRSYDSAQYNPRANLTIAQNEILNSFIQRLADLKSRKDRRFCTEACLLRYLRAREWNLDKAEKMLMNTLQWRKEYKPDKIAPSEVTHCAETGKVFINGKDKLGRPLVFLIPRHENSKDYVNNVRLVVYVLERAIQQMDEGVEQIVLMMDFKGYSRGNSVPLGVAREVLSILSNHYPERLGAAFMIDTPWLFSLFWKAISPFIHPVTAAKVKFLSSKDHAITDAIDTKQLEPADRKSVV